ncbi:MAG: membrane protein insertase YidC [Planctomycetota bacterium]
MNATRFVVTALAIAVGLGVVVSVIMSGKNPAQDGDESQAGDSTPAQQADNTPAPSGDEQDSNPEPPTADPDGQPENEEPENQPEPGSDPGIDAQPGTDPEDSPAPTVKPLDNLRADFSDARANPLSIGSQDPDSGFMLEAQIDPYRAGLLSVTLSQYSEAVNSPDRYNLLAPIDLSPDNDKIPAIGSYAARKIVINGKQVQLYRLDEETGGYLGNWEVVESSAERVKLALTIYGGPDDEPVEIARMVRTYSVSPGSYTISLDQTVENLTDKQLRITWSQFGPGDVHHNPSDYLRGRSRQYVLGYFDDDYDPSRFSIRSGDGFIPRPDVVDHLKQSPVDREGEWQTLWGGPNPKTDNTDKALAWLAVENRYFAVITSAHIPVDTTESADITPLSDLYPVIDTAVTPSEAQDKDASVDDRKVLMFFTSNEVTLAPKATTLGGVLSMDIFAGPREDKVYRQAPYQAMRLDETIRYSLGGCCGFCTFQWLAHGLLGFLELIHWGVRDWGVAIIILVLIVRVVLHPITKRGQINMMKMGKQMAAVQPEMEKLKKKFADDARGMQQAQMQLFREKGINPAASAVGCLPMFLQMPIWIALYAMLYYAIELRQEAAFYELFQVFGGWPFLADLSVSDRFIPLFPDDGTHVLNLWFIVFDYSAINILPLLMGVTFFFNMKFTSPPPANEQQAQQQKIMRIMPFLMPFFLYSAPAGLTLYICASTFAGIVDSYLVRKHVKELEESGELFKKKDPKPGGLMDKLSKLAEEAQKRQAEAAKQQDKNRGPQQNKRRKRK